MAENQCIDLSGKADVMVKEKPLVSVIVPIYKVEQYIVKSVESIINQTYRNLEIILVDDGSPDACGDIADEFAGKDARIKVVHKKNGGLSDARNAGLKVASGEYIYFFDSDDSADIKLLETAMQPYLTKQTDLVCFNYVTVDEISGDEEKTAFSPAEYQWKGKRTNLSIREYLGYRMGYCVWNKLYRADIIREHEISFEDNSKIFSEDICFNLYYLFYCHSVQVIPDYLYYYLYRQTSIMGKSKKEPRLDQFIELSKCYNAYLLRSHERSEMLCFQEIVFSELMKLQLRKVSSEERPFWVEKIKDKKFFYENSERAVRRIDKWIKVYGLFTGIKRWMGAAECYYSDNESGGLRALRHIASRLKKN